MREKTLKGPWRDIMKELSLIKQPFGVCFEASCGFGVMSDAFGRLAERVEVAHPGKLRLIFGTKKNDRLDAEKLAKLL